MREKFTAIAKAIKEGAAASQLKYKELNNEATKVELTESKVSIDELKVELKQQEKAVALIEKQLAYHQVMLRTQLSEQTRLNAQLPELLDDERFLDTMAELDEVNKDIEYRHVKIAKFTAEYQTEKEVLESLKKDLVACQQTHRDKLNRLIHEEEKLASELEKRRLITVTN